jgi:hypothetical protein
VVQAITASAPRFVLHTGDLTANGTNDAYWQTEFFDPAASLLADIPLFPSLGNHEQNATLYYDYFDLPEGGATTTSAGILSITEAPISSSLILTQAIHLEAHNTTGW